MERIRTLVEEIHLRAVEASRRYKKAEAELVGILDEVDTHRVFLEKGCSSLFQYVVNELGLSENVAYNLIAVSRKAREIPGLRTEIEKGTISLSNARKIVPILTQKNASEWLKKASELSQRQLEREVVKVRPQQATPERASYVTPMRVRLELGLFEKDMLKLRRVQDLLSQARGRAASLEESLVALMDEYLERHDPLENAKRVLVKKGLSDLVKTHVSHQSGETPRGLTSAPVPAGAPLRENIPAKILHRVALRDQRQCAFVSPKGQRCKQRRWLQVHHLIPVAEGGSNDLENLLTLCSAHHAWIHARKSG